jgi:alkylated DNA repair protein (DNA oxidative demethylase)
MSASVAPHLAIAPGIDFWPGYFSQAEQRALFDDVLARAARAPFYTPAMPKSGVPFSVAMTNFGALGWVSDKDGYRYRAQHPITGEAWPDIPPALLALWDALTGYGAPPQACLVNFYATDAKMGLHRDADEEARDAPVLSVSLGDTALFRIGGNVRKGPARNVRWPRATCWCSAAQRGWPITASRASCLERVDFCPARRSKTAAGSTSPCAG